MQLTRDIKNLKEEIYKLKENINAAKYSDNPNEFSDGSNALIILNKKISDLEAEKKLFYQYTDRYFFNNIIEYGLNETSSVGIIFEKKKQSFFGEDKIFQNGAFFYKKQLCNKQKFVMRTHIQGRFDTKNSTSKIFGEIGVEMAFVRKLQKKYKDKEGKTRKKNIGQAIVEYDIHVGFPVSSPKTPKNNSYLSLARGETIKSTSGWFVCKYFMITIKNTSKLACARTIYRKISIGKEFIFANDKKVTFDIGYFKNQSENFEKLKITGLAMSLSIEC